MSLSLSEIQDGLAVLFGRDGTEDFPQTVIAAGNSWADVIHGYSEDGTANGNAVNILVASKAALASALISGFSTLPGTPATVASAIITALDAYWFTVTVSGATSTGISTGGPGLISALTGIFAVAGGTAQSKADQIGQAIDTYTKLVSFIFPGPTVFFVL